ncbi:hypothetical protein [Streptomyces sp. NBC_01244]|uniref:hypothetical protein n=1 Tax=Streptomyces sp. NBC_01244 TaxID=2903797 RepID=UPI002E0FE079|nr:hypothetical protein OG247_44425 [Streptomyces sp. NBC_01244]
MNDRTFASAGSAAGAREHPAGEEVPEITAATDEVGVRHLHVGRARRLKAYPAPAAAAK